MLTEVKQKTSIIKKTQWMNLNLSSMPPITKATGSTQVNLLMSMFQWYCLVPIFGGYFFTSNLQMV